MASPECIITNLKRLVRNLRGPDVPAAAELQALAADWAALLEDTADEVLDDAVAAHLRDPERGRWWPTVADLRARMDLDPVDDGDEHEQAWDWIVECAKKGRSTVEYMGAEHQQALREIGGILAVRMSGDGAARDERVPGQVLRATLRKRFLDICRRTDGPRPALTDRRPALRALPGGVGGLRRIGEGS